MQPRPPAAFCMLPRQSTSSWTGEGEAREKSERWINKQESP